MCLSVVSSVLSDCSVPGVGGVLSDFSVSSVFSDCGVPGVLSDFSVSSVLSYCSVLGVAGVLSDCSVSVTVVSLVPLVSSVNAVSPVFQ